LAAGRDNPNRVAAIAFNESGERLDDERCLARSRPTEHSATATLQDRVKRGLLV
jgi:hypothetical protein